MTTAPSSDTPTRKRLKPGERRAQILQTLAAMLQEPGNERITTAALAKRLQVSEAALYRHFASKAQMFEGLLDFIEQTVLSLVQQIAGEEAVLGTLTLEEGRADCWAQALAQGGFDLVEQLVHARLQAFVFALQGIAHHHAHHAGVFFGKLQQNRSYTRSTGAAFFEG